MSNLGKAIRIIRMEKEVKALTLAFCCSITPSYLSLIETNKKVPSLEILNRICEALNVKLSMLILKAEEYE